MSLGLGTVQFGQAYGISNQRGRVPPEEAAAIMRRAAAGGVSVLDTAANYGDAENVLAALDTAPFRIVTKTISLSHGLDAVIARAKESARILNADTLLVHAAGDLNGADGARYWSALRGLKEAGIVRRIGISAYVADDPAALAARFRPDVMQVPFSLLDQRLLTDGTMERLGTLGVEIHARSLFLQGLLFMRPDRLKGVLARAAAPLADLHARLAKAGITPLAAALGFVLSQRDIAVGLVGVTSVAELEEIFTAAAQPLPDLDWASFALDDEILLTPSRW